MPLGIRALLIWRIPTDKGYSNVRWVDGKFVKFSKDLLRELPQTKDYFFQEANYGEARTHSWWPFTNLTVKRRIEYEK